MARWTQGEWERYLELQGLGKPGDRVTGRGNRRVRNACKQVMTDGVCVDSRLEGYMRQGLLDSGIGFKFHYEVILQPGTVYHGKKVRKISWVPDFYFPQWDLYVDTKGWITEIARIKIKLFKYRYLSSSLVLIRTRGEADAFIYGLKVTPGAIIGTFMER